MNATTQTDYKAIRDFPPTGVTAITGTGLIEPLPMLSGWFALDAFKMTNSLLDDFEKSEFRRMNSKLLTCIGLWFLMMESGISTVFKIISEPRHHSAYQKLPQKFAKIPHILGSTEMPSDIQMAEFKEFCCFRNKTFHDLYYPQTDTQYHKTQFAKVPAYANEIDLMEAVRISVNSLNYYRYILQGVSMIERNLDIVLTYQNTLLPRFQQIMQAKGFMPVEFRPLDTVICSTLSPGTYAAAIKL